MKVGETLKDEITGDSFKVLKIEGDGEFAWVTLLHLRYGLKYTNFMNNLSGLKPTSIET